MSPKSVVTPKASEFEAYRVAINKNKVNDNALKYIQKGQVRKAIREYEKILAEDPKDVRTLLKKGDLLVRVGENEQALETYSIVAKTYSQQGFHLKAVAVYKQILKIDEYRIDVNLHLAAEYQSLGIAGDAMGHLQKVATYYDQRGMKKQLMEILRRLIDLDPDNVASRIKLAELFSQEGMNTEAVEEFSQAAKYLKVTNRIEDYIKVVERLLYHNSSDILLVRELANIYLQRGDAKRALSKLQACFKADPSDIDTLSMLALAFKELRQPAKMVSVYKEMVSVYQQRGEEHEVQRVYRRILELSPEDPEARRALNMEATAIHRGELREASLSNRAVPGSQEFAVSVDQPASAGSPDAATVANSDMIRLEAPSSQARPTGDIVKKTLTETDVYIKYGLQNKAVEHLKGVFEVDPENIEAHEKLKDVYVANKQIDEAVGELLALVHLAYRQGRIEEARGHLRALLILSPNHPQGQELVRELGERAAEDTDDILDEGLPMMLDSALGSDMAPDESTTIELPPQSSLDEFDEDSYSYLDKLEDEVPIELDQEDYVGLEQGIEDVEILDSSEHDLHGAREIPADIDTDLPVSFDEPTGRSGPESADEPYVLLDARRGTGTDEISEVSEDLVVLESDNMLEEEPEPREDFVGEPELIEVEEIDASFDQLEEALDDDLSAGVDVPTQMVENPMWHQEPEQGIMVDDPDISDVSFLEEETEHLQPHAESGALEDQELRDDEIDEDLADAIDEVDFFIQQNLFDEAVDELERLREQHPDHPEILNRLAQIDRLQQGEVPLVSAEVDESDLSMDLAEQIACEVEDDLEPVALGEDFQYSVNDVFNEFKKGVAKLVDKDDSSTHYELGIAYKEMGLLDEAISEFSIAASGTQKRVVALTMIGLCYCEKDQPAQAVEHFKNALEHPGISEREKTSLHYEMGQTCQKDNQPKQALLHFREVQKRDAQFRDVAEKIRSLSRAKDGKGSEAEAVERTTDGKNKISYM